MLIKTISSLFIAACVFSAGCTTNTNVGWHTINLKNACVVNAYGWQAAYNEKNASSSFWSKILVIKWSNEKNVVNSHVIVLIEKSDGIWMYDDGVVGKLTKDVSMKDNPHKMAEKYGMPFINAYYYYEEN